MSTTKSVVDLQHLLMQESPCGSYGHGCARNVSPIQQQSAKTSKFHVLINSNQGNARRHSARRCYLLACGSGQNQIMLNLQGILLKSAPPTVPPSNSQDQESAPEAANPAPLQAMNASHLIDPNKTSRAHVTRVCSHSSISCFESPQDRARSGSICNVLLQCTNGQADSRLCTWIPASTQHIVNNSEIK